MVKIGKSELHLIGDKRADLLAIKKDACTVEHFGFDENGNPNDKCPKCGYDPTMGK